VTIETGLTAALTLCVSEADTALAWRSGDVPVLGTPRLIALCEEAAITALAGHLVEGTTTVGLSVRLDHLHPVAIGSTVKAEASLDRIEGRRLVFTVTAHDDRGIVAAGKVTRVVIDREAFLAKSGA